MEPENEKASRKGKIVSLPLSPELHNELRSIADNEGNPITSVIRHYIRQGLESRQANPARQAVTQ